MGSFWVQVDTEAGSARRPLTAAGLQLGERGEPAPALLVPGAGDDRLVLQADPLRGVFEGRGESPLLRGKPLRAGPLAAGDMIAWHGARLRIGSDVATLEPLDLERLPGPLAETAPQGGAAGRRVQAGLLVELGLVEPEAARRAQDAIVARAFDPDRAAAELLAAARAPADDSRLLERSARLMRDLVMAPAQSGLRGARQRVRRATRHGLAWLVAQFLVVAAVAAMLLVAGLLARAQWGLSIDGFLDRALGLFGRG